MSELEMAIGKVELAADFLSGSYLQSRIVEAVQAAVISSTSPWLDRKAAAAYCHCSASEIDRCANAGVIKRYMRAATPMFKKAEIDAAINDGRWVGRSKP